MRYIILSSLLLVLIAGCTPSLCKDDDACFEKARETQDISYCEEINVESIEKSCIAEITDDCSILEGQAKARCQFNNIETKEGCFDIETEYWRDICFNDFGKKDNDLKMCKEIISSKLKDECYITVASSTKNPAACTTIDDTTLKNHCIKTIAFEDNDVTACDFIADKLVRYGECYHKIGAETLNKSICNMIPFDVIEESCLERVDEKLEEDTSSA
jgi:hypothetical protein